MDPIGWCLGFGLPASCSLMPPLDTPLQYILHTVKDACYHCIDNKVLPNGALQSCRSILHRQFIIFDTAQVIFRCAKLGKPRNEWYPAKCSFLEQNRGNSQSSSNSFLSILVLSHFLGKLLYIIPTPWKINMKPISHPLWKGKSSSKPPINCVPAVNFPGGVWCI